MTSIRRHISAIGIIWLVFQAGVLAVSPFVNCCPAPSQSTVEDDDCCAGMAPGQICPLHKHRKAPPTNPHHDEADRCAIRGGCGPSNAALIPLVFGLGIVPEPLSLHVILVSNRVPSLAAHTVHRARSLDPPPPRS